MTEAAHAPVYEEKPKVMLSPGAARYILDLSDPNRDDSVGAALRQVASGQKPESLADVYERTAAFPVLSDSIMNELAGLAAGAETAQ